MAGGLPYQGLGPESNAHAGDAQHGEIVGPISDRNHLFERDVFLLRNQAQSEKRKVWEDMLMVLEKLGRPITEKQQNYFLAR